MAEQPKKNTLGKKKISEASQDDSVFLAPEILREPGSRQAKLGSNIILRIAATGRPLPSFQWFHNGKKISGANSDRLTIHKARRTAMGAYHCEVKNHAGHAVSRQCMLSFFTKTLPKLVLEKTEMQIEEGSPILIKLVQEKPGAFKDFRISWIFNGMRIKGAHGPELSISSGKKKYEGEYKAIVSVGSGIESSNVCRVKIFAAAKGDTPEDGTMVGTLMPPVEEEAPAPAVAAAAAADWADSTFNPEEEDIAPAAGLEPLPEPESEPLPEKEESSVAMEFVREVTKKIQVREILTQDPQPSPLSLIEQAKNTTPKKPKKKPAPHLLKKKKFLENALARWQSRNVSLKQAA